MCRANLQGLDIIRDCFDRALAYVAVKAAVRCNISRCAMAVEICLVRLQWSRSYLRCVCRAAYPGTWVEKSRETASGAFHVVTKKCCERRHASHYDCDPHFNNAVL